MNTETDMKAACKKTAVKKTKVKKTAVKKTTGTKAVEGKTAASTATTKKVMNAKAQQFQSMLDRQHITAFQTELVSDTFHTAVFRTQVNVQKHLLPTVVILDDTIYSLLRVFVVMQVVTEKNKGEISQYLNKLNKQFKAFKYYISDAGDVVLDCCMTADNTHFDPNMVHGMLDLILQHLSAIYADIIKKIQKI